MATEKRGAQVNPSESSESAGTNPGNMADQGQQDESRTKEYKNIETSAGNKDYFNDDYEAGQENEISRDETRTEDENNVPNRKRND